jgi:transcription initiation factor TFIID TATA-box-binding protein
VTNIVANASLGFEVDLTGMSEQPDFFKDEHFPGVIYKMKDPVKAVLIFSSGKMVFTGAKNIENIRLAFHKMLGFIEDRFKKVTPGAE